MAQLAAAGLAGAQTSPEQPVPPLFCVTQYAEGYHTDNMQIFVRNGCDEAVDWIACLRDGDMSSSEVYEGTLEPGHQVYFETTHSVGLGVKASFFIFVNYHGQELPWPNC